MELRSFLGLTNYYRRLIKGHSTIVAPLTNLLKKTTKWQWAKMSQQAFDALKKDIIEEPILALPNHALPFKVHTDAFDFAIRGVLMQGEHPIAFKSWKLNDMEQQYTVQKKEMTW